MKRILAILSLSVLFLGNFSANLSYSYSEQEDEAIEILWDELKKFNNNWWQSLVENVMWINSIKTLETDDDEDLETFTTYTVNVWWTDYTIKRWDTTYTDIIEWNGWDLMNNFSYRTLTIWDITIMDRNLWATDVWSYTNDWSSIAEENIPWSFGYYYQWWNNYWFKPGVTPEQSSSSVSSATDPYSSSIWRTINSWSSSALRWWYVWTDQGKQWPCPDNWHVPSIDEWKNLLTVLWNTSTDWKWLAQAIKLPAAGERSYSNLNFYSAGVNGYYWASLVSDRNYSKNLYFNESEVKSWSDSSRSFWFNIRCFKNTPIYDKVTFYPNWWAFSWMEKNETKKYEYSYNENWNIIPIYTIEIPNRESIDLSQQSWWMFAWRYTKDWIDWDWGEELNLQRPQAKRAYAKWLPFNDLDLDVIWLSGVKIMDRNMWAEAVAEWIFYWYGNVPHESNSLLGYFYQWWNNYWFTSSWDLLEGEGSNTQISNQFHSTNPWWPSNPFYNNVFIMRRYTTSYSRSVEDNRNLRWWSSVLDKDKKWPCPEWYHIPVKSERDFVKNSFMALKSDICDENSSQLWSCFARSLKLPYAGYRAYDYSRLRSQGGQGNYWLSTSYNKNKAYSFSFSDNALNISSDYITYGKSVRCFKDSLYRLTFNLDNWDKIVYSKKWRDPIYPYLKPEEQTRTNAEFLWRWELDRDDLFKFGPDVFLTWNVELYPKFKCNFWYTESQDWKSCDKIVVNYFSDNKLVASMSPVINSIEVPVTWETYSFTWENQFLEYKENDFLNILRQIQKPWYKIEWWYYSWMQEKFNYKTVSTWEVINVYAKWEPITYTISFNLNWWVGNINEVVATYWEQINLPTPARQWYVFKWWQSEDWIVFNWFISEWTWATTVDWSTIMLTAVWESIANSLSAWGWSTIKSVKAENEVTKLEHNSADIESSVVEESKSEYNTAVNEFKNDSKLQQRSLTRWEVAVMTNILLDVFPELINWKQEIDDVTNACSNYADEQKFSKDERKAITRLCKLSIMWIHADNNEPLDEFMVNQWTKNDEFSKVINRSISTYNEKDFTVVKDALKKLENSEENVEFWTVYDIFMSIKNIFS